MLELKYLTKGHRPKWQAQALPLSQPYSTLPSSEYGASLLKLHHSNPISHKAASCSPPPLGQILCFPWLPSLVEASPVTLTHSSCSSAFSKSSGAQIHHLAPTLTPFSVISVCLSSQSRFPILGYLPVCSNSSRILKHKLTFPGQHSLILYHPHPLGLEDPPDLGCLRLALSLRAAGTVSAHPLSQAGIILEPPCTPASPALPLSILP